MSDRSARGVALTPQFTRFIDKMVRTGRYRSQSEVVRDALRLMMDREQGRAIALNVLRQQIEVGVTQAERGRTIDGAACMRRWEQAERRAARPKRRKVA